MDKLKLPHALVILGILALLGFLAWKGVDSAPVAVGLAAMLGALGWVVKNQGEQAERSQSIATNVNGNTSRMLEMLNRVIEANTQMAAQNAAMLALMTPASKEAEARVMELTAAASVVPISVPPAPPTGSPSGLDT